MFSFLLLTSCNDNGKTAGDAGALRFNLQKGQAYAYAMEVDMETEAGGNKMESEMDFDYDIEVTDKQDSITTLKSTYKRVVMKMDMPGMNVDIDTDKPATDSVVDIKTNPMGMMGSMFRAIVGKSFVMKVNPEGQVTEISGLKEMSDAMLGSINLDESMKPMAERAFSQQFNEETLKQSFAQAFNIFPNKAVKKGDTWTKTVDMNGMAIKTVYTVKDVDDNKVMLDANATMDMGQNKGTQTGTLEIDPKTGLVREGNLEQKVTGENMTMNSKIKISGKVK